MLSRIKTLSVIEKMTELSKEMNLLIEGNIGMMRLKTTKVLIEAMEDDLVVDELAKKLVGLWFPYLSSSLPAYSQWLDINMKVCGIILESGYYEDDIWSGSDVEEES